MKYGRLTRILHALLAIAISLQLLSSLVMRTPRPGRVLTPLQAFGFESHRVIGVTAFCVLLLHWLVFVSGYAYKGVGHFYPWFSRTRRAALLDEIHALTRLHVPDPRHKDSLAGAVEGLGLAVGSVLALSGTVLFLGMAPNGTMSAGVHVIKEFHEFWGPVMWTYLGIHGGAVLVHLWSGHRSILSVFSW
jgi:cytochrome b561